MAVQLIRHVGPSMCTLPFGGMWYMKIVYCLALKLGILQRENIPQMAVLISSIKFSEALPKDCVGTDLLKLCL